MRSCFLCGLSEARLIRESVEVSTDPRCPLTLCERCEGELKPRKYEQCRQCGREFRQHEWRNAWLRFFNAEIRLRAQVRDKLTIKEEFFEDRGERQHFFLLVDLLLDCRRTGGSTELEAQLRDTIERFIDQKRLAQGIHKMVGQEQKLQHPRFIRKIENPGIGGGPASGYDLEACYRRGLDMLHQHLARY